VFTRYPRQIRRVIGSVRKGLNRQHIFLLLSEYDLSDGQVEQNGRLWWACTCSVKSWSVQKTGLADSKKAAKRYAAYLGLVQIPCSASSFNVVTAFSSLNFSGRSSVVSIFAKTQEKVKADLFEAILGAIAIDSDWNADEIQNSVSTIKPK